MTIPSVQPGQSSYASASSTGSSQTRLLSTQENIKTVKWAYEFLRSTGRLPTDSMRRPTPLQTTESTAVTADRVVRATDDKASQTDEKVMVSASSPTSVDVVERRSPSFYRKIVEMADSVIGRYGDHQQAMMDPVYGVCEHIKSVDFAFNRPEPQTYGRCFDRNNPTDTVTSESLLDIRAKTLEKLVQEEGKLLLVFGALSQLPNGSALRNLLGWFISTAEQTSEVKGSEDHPKEDEAKGSETEAEANAKTSFLALPQPVQKALCGYLEAKTNQMFFSVSGLTAPYIADRFDLLKFALVKGSNAPTKMMSILNFYSVKSAFELHGDKLPKDVAGMIKGTIAAIDSRADKEGHENLYSFYNSTDKVVLDGRAYRGGISQAIEDIGNILQNELTPQKLRENSETAFARDILNQDEIDNLLSSLPKEEMDIALTILKELEIPKVDMKSRREVKRLDGKAKVNLETLPLVLGKRLLLKQQDTTALVNLVKYHQTKAQYTQLKESSKAIHEERKTLVDRSDLVYQKIRNEEFATIEDGHALQQEFYAIEEKLAISTLSLTDEQIKVMDKILAAASASISAFEGGEFVLKTFRVDQNVKPLTDKQLFAKLSRERCEHIGLNTPICALIDLLENTFRIDSKMAKEFHFEINPEHPIADNAADRLIDTMNKRVPPNVKQALIGLFQEADGIYKALTGSAPALSGTKTRPLYLHGPSGPGKSRTTRQLLKESGLEVIDFKAVDVTIKGVKEAIDRCQSTNFALFVDEAGEVLSEKRKGLDSQLWAILDPESKILQEELSRAVIVLTANETDLDKKMNSRMDWVKWEKITPFTLEERVNEGFDQCVRSKKFLNKRIEDQLRDHLIESKDAIFEGIVDQRVILKFSKKYTGVMVDFFSKELNTLGKKDKLDFTAWEVHLKDPDVKESLEEYLKKAIEEVKTEENRSAVGGAGMLGQNGHKNKTDWSKMFNESLGSSYNRPTRTMERTISTSLAATPSKESPWDASSKGLFETMAGYSYSSGVSRQSHEGLSPSYGGSRNYNSLMTMDEEVDIPRPPKRFARVERTESQYYASPQFLRMRVNESEEVSDSDEDLDPKLG